MTKPDFSSILDEAPTEVSYPPSLPQGTWAFSVKSWESVKSSRKGTEGIKFTLNVLHPGEDVDEDDLAAYGEYRGRTITMTFWDSDYFLPSITEFHQNCGLDISEKKSIKLRNDEVIGAEFGGYVKQTPTEDGNRTRSEVTKTFAVE